MPQVATNWLPIANASVAWLALLVAIFGLLYSRQALKVARAKQEREQAGLSFYLHTAYYETSDDNSVVLNVKIDVTNKSDIPTSIIRFELERVVRLTHTDTAPLRIPVFEVSDQADNKLYLPIDLSPRQARTLRIGFKIPQDRHTPGTGRDQRVLITDAFDETRPLPINLVSGHV
jgi:hypothetical protein